MTYCREHREQLNTYQRKYYQRNKEKILARQRSKRADPEYRLRENVWQRSNYKKHLEKVLYRCAKERAQRKEIEFNLQISDIKIPEYCPYLHTKLSSGTYSDRKSGNSPTIDRIVPSLGYIPSNIEVISDLANRMKDNATQEQLVVFAKSILSRYDSE
jgi:exonuclease VII large subunit